MKTLGFLCISVFLVSTAFPKSKDRLSPKELETEVKQVVLITDLSSQMTKDLFAGLHPNIAVECKEGTELPFKYTGNFGLFSVNFTPNLSIKLEKTSYLRFIRTRPDKPKSLRGYISFDLKSWERLSKFDVSDKQDFSFGMSPDKSHILCESKIVPQAE
jgi:hypothetical protein